ncbi:DUF2723 domain-containing protein [bacterium]|nr:DUF2723 domain-containing protein [candidate division CSSED10-310 bacterium]
MGKRYGDISNYLLQTFSINSAVSVSFFKNILYIIIFLSIFGIFLFSVAPTIYWGDDGYLISSCLTYGLGHPPGHGLYIFLENPMKWLPFGDIAYRFNLCSALLMAFGIATVFYFIQLISKQNVSGILGGLFAIGFLLGHPFIWHQSLRAETYALHVFLLIISISALSWGNLPKRLLTGTFIGFLMLFNQTFLAVLALPGLLILWLAKFYLSKEKSRLLVFTVILIVLGASLVIFVPLRSKANPEILWNQTVNLNSTFNYVSAKEYRNQFFVSDNNNEETLTGNLATVMRYQIKQSRWWLLLSIFGFTWGLLKRPSVFGGLLLIASTTLIGTTACRTFSIENWDFQGYLCPTLIILAISGGFLIATAVDYAKNRFVLIGLLSLCIYPFIKLPFFARDVSLSNHVYARYFGICYIENLPYDSILFTRSDLYFIVRYLQIAEHFRDDIDVISVNRLFRNRNPDFFHNISSRLKYIDPTFMDNRTWMQKLIQKNEGMYAIYWENAEFLSSISPDQVSIQGPLLTVSGGDNSFNKGRNFETFLRISDNGAKFWNDNNAVEQVSTILYNRGVFFLHNNRHMEALREFSLSLILEPSNAECQNNLGVVLSLMGRKSDAKIHFEKALNIDPYHENARRNLKLMDEI